MASEASEPPVRAEPQGLPQVSVLDFPPDPDELAGLRDHTRVVLRRWGLDWVAKVACLLVNELATNAIAHTRKPARLRITRDEALLIAVTDTDPSPPTPRQPSVHDSTGGRGLIMIGGLADHWDYSLDGDGGKTVWCELRAE